jgi:5-methylthioribose kinase
MEGERRRFVARLFEDSLRFAGTKMTRRILGLAHVEELESIEDRQVRAACESEALDLARKLVLGASFFGNIQAVTTEARAIRKLR